jgi:hypothetical protein
MIMFLLEDELTFRFQMDDFTRLFRKNISNKKLKYFSFSHFGNSKMRLLGMLCTMSSYQAYIQELQGKPTMAIFVHPAFCWPTACADAGSTGDQRILSAGKWVIVTYLPFGPGLLWPYFVAAIFREHVYARTATLIRRLHWKYESTTVQFILRRGNDWRHGVLTENLYYYDFAGWSFACMVAISQWEAQLYLLRIICSVYFSFRIKLIPLPQIGKSLLNMVK